MKKDRPLIDINGIKKFNKFGEVVSAVSLVSFPIPPTLLSLFLSFVVLYDYNSLYFA